METSPSILTQLKRFFVPSAGNNYHPYALRRSALFAYSIFLLLINFFAGQFTSLVPDVSAADISSSRLIQLVNKERSASGLASLKTNSRLTKAAKNKANDMFEKGYWSHYGPSGETPWQFILGSGYSYIYAGENLAKDFATTDAIHSAWMASPTHRANIMKSQYRDIGIAAITGTFNGETTTIVVQMFGTTSSGSSDIDTLPTTAENDDSESGTINPPTITYPENGGTYNDKTLHIKGKVSTDGKQVTLYDNSIKIGTLLTEGGIFDYRPSAEWEDATHSVNATVTHKTSGIVSAKSSKVKFTIDTGAPALVEDSVEIVELEAEDASKINFNISFNASADLAKAFLVVGDKSYEFSEVVVAEDQESSLASGEFTVTSKQLESQDYNAKLSLQDKATNESTSPIDLSSLAESDSSSDSGLFLGIGSIFTAMSQIDSMSFVSKVTFMVALFIAVIFGIDAVVLWRMGVMREGAKSVLSAFIFSVVLLVGVFIGTGSALI